MNQISDKGIIQICWLLIEEYIHRFWGARLMRTNKFFCLFGVLSSFWSASMFAVDCNEESRGFQLQGEAYFNVDNPI
jgi:hypothetical protein